MRKVSKWMLAYFAAVAVSAILFWIAPSFENWYCNFCNGIESEHGDVHSIKYWIDSSRWLLVYAIIVTIFAAPFAIGFSIFFERLGKRPHLIAYVIVGALAGFAGIILMSIPPNFDRESLWSYFLRVHLGWGGGALGGVIFGLIRKL